MRKWLPFLLILSVLFNLGVLLGWLGRPWCDGRRQKRSRSLVGGPRGMSSRRIERMTEVLKLTSEQVAGLEAIAERFAGQRAQLRKQFMAAKQELNSAVFAAGSTPESVEATQKSLPLEAMMKLMIAERLAINALLTEEQRNALLKYEESVGRERKARYASKRPSR